MGEMGRERVGGGEVIKKKKGRRKREERGRTGWRRMGEEGREE